MQPDIEENCAKQHACDHLAIREGKARIKIHGINAIGILPFLGQEIPISAQIALLCLKKYFCCCLRFVKPPVLNLAFKQFIQLGGSTSVNKVLLVFEGPVV